MRIATRLVGGLLVMVGCLMAGPGAALADAEGIADPSTARPGGTVRFSVTCGEGMSPILYGQTLGLEERIPMTTGADPANYYTDVVVPQGTEPGTYDVNVDCSDSESTSIQLVVSPSGGAATGDGATSQPSAPSAPLLAAGIALLAAAGLVALWRRRSPTRG